MTELRNGAEFKYWNLVILLVVVTSLWALSGFALYNTNDRGTFGDMFGAINALFSGLAFASIIYTIFLQREELKLQREELGLTRNELNGQKMQMSAQNEVLKLQNFENTFFQLIRLLNDTVREIDVNNGSRLYTGKDSFNFFLGTINRYYSVLKKTESTLIESEIIDGAYKKFYESHQGDLGHYFRTLYNIIKFVHYSAINDKKFYTNLVRAQLSNQELIVIFYNCQTEYGSYKFRPLIEEYAIFKTLPKHHLFDESHIYLYGRGAYGRS